MTAITVTIPGEPIPYARAGGRAGGGRLHDDRTRDYMQKVGLFAMQAIGNARRIGIAWPRSGVKYAALVLVVRTTHHVADLDNIAKSVLDGATGPAALWLNDSDVDDLRVKRCAPDRENPRVLLMVSTIPKASPIDDCDWLIPQRWQP